jgi:hypothetical protein
MWAGFGFSSAIGPVILRLPSTRSWRPPDPYAPTIGAVAAASTTSPVAPLGDPAKVAAVVVQVATMADPPRRLLLGSDAVAAAAAAGQARATEDAAWQAVSRSTDRDAALPCPRANSTPWQPSPTPQRPPPTDRSASRGSHSPWRRPS